MPGRLEGKVAIVTGAGSSGPGVGIGKAIAMLFAREGARVGLVDVEPAHAEETLRLIHDEGGDACVIAGDVSDEHDCGRIVGDTVERYGKLDVLVNNAAIIGPTGPVDTLAEADWNRVLQVDLTGVMLMSKHALPRLIEGDGGAIVNISSGGAFVSTGEVPAYATAKAGVIRLTAELAVAYGRRGVRANAIAPGIVNTPMAERGRPFTPEKQAYRAKLSPLGIAGTAWDVAWAAVFLASDEARFITGACLAVDGGMTQTNPEMVHRWLSE